MESDKRVWLGLAGALALAFGVTEAPSAEASGPTPGPDAPGQAGRCGGPGQPACPMQAFMRTAVAAPLAANNIQALAAGLDRVAAYTPEPGWTSWRTFARNGAKAARAGNLAGVRASCKGCHDAWRAPYRAKHRARPVGR